MSKVKAIKELEYSKWDKDKRICCCSYNKPLCNNFNNCEIITVTIDPYDDIKDTFKNNSRRYKRVHNRLRQY